MNRLLSFFLSLSLIFSLTACGGQAAPAESESIELTVFAAASLTETLDAIAEQYKEIAPDVTLVFNYDSSGTLLTQIEEGAQCDLFLSAAQKQMDTLEEEGGIDPATRKDLLENKVTLCVPEGNPAGVTGFADMAARLNEGTLFMGIGNEDVPVGQYTRKIFDHFGLDESAIASCLTEGSNVKEVTTAVSEASVDCGIIYCTDAFSAGLEIIDYADAEMCGQVIYPAAVTADSTHAEAAKAFLEYLSGEDCAAVFETVGFTALS